jgi:hemerythrin-like domain-containing protein
MKTKWIGTSLAAFAVCVAAGVWMSSSDFHASAEEPKGSAVPWKVPASLKAEHEELHAELLEATRSGGQTADAAKEVARLLHAHFEKEEEYALPPLGLLPQLADGKVTPEMQQVISQTDRLRADLPQMLKEHEAVVAALEDLAKAAMAERKPQHVRFAEKLKSHAKTEEEILYPTAILIGEYLKLKFPAK